MGSFTMDAASRYAAGSTVLVYREEAIVNGSQPTQAPVTSAVVGVTGAVTFSGLEEDTRYVAAQSQGGRWVLTSFRVSVSEPQNLAEAVDSLHGLESVVEVSVLEYASSHGVDRGGSSGSDSSPGWRALASDLSAAMAASTLALGVRHVARMIVPKGAYNLKTAVNPTPWVRWEIDEATLIKGADATNTAQDNNLIYAPEVQRPSASAGTGTTVNGSYFVTAVSQMSAWGRRYPISGPGIPAGTLVLGVDRLNNTLTLDKPAGGGAGTGTITRGATYRGNYDGFRITGGYITANGKTAWGNLVRLLWCDGLRIDGTKWLDYAPPAASSPFLGSMSLLRSGDNHDINVEFQDAPNQIHNDGDHFAGGINSHSVVRGYAGDDLAAFGAITTASMAAEPDPIDGVIADVQGTSWKGNLVRVHVEAGVTAENKNGRVVASGKSGVNRNGCLYVVDENHPAIGSELIANWGIFADIDGGSPSHDETLPVFGHVESARDITIRGKGSMVDKASPTTGWWFGYFRDAKNLRFEVDCPALQKNVAVDALRCENLQLGGTWVASSTTTTVLFLDTCPGTELKGKIQNVQSGQNAIGGANGSSLVFDGTIEYAPGATAGKGIAPASAWTKLAIAPTSDLTSCPEPLDLANARAITELSISEGIFGISPESVKPPALSDSFRGDVLADQWAGWKGTDGVAALPVVVAEIGGGVDLVTGADAAGTHTVNGSRLDTFKQWLPTKGGLAFECRLYMSAITNVLVCLGLTSTTGSAQNPAEMTGADAVITNPNDGVWWLFDTTALTDVWWLIGTKAGVDATPQNTGLVPVASTYAIFRIEVSIAGVATFFYNGVKVGTAMANALTPSVAYAPVISAVSRAAASRTIRGKYIRMEQHA